MKKVAILLTVFMLMSGLGISSFAEDAAVKESTSGYYYIEASGDQVALSAKDAARFIQADGLYFKDSNGNGELDVYEDWRLPAGDRVNDLLSQMTVNEKAGALTFAGISGRNGIVVSEVNKDEILYADDFYVTIDDANYASLKYQIQTMGANTFIAAMTGEPKEQLEILNKIQGIGEESRLGIPIVFSGDRSYNTWGGMIDMAHYAFGVAHDEELLYNLASEYAKESVALGYHQVFHGYGNEIGAWYGDEVNYISKMAVAETRAYDDNGFNSHSKHFIARGGRNSFAAAQSPANLWESYMVGWKAVVDAGTQWIMTNNNVGLTPGVQSYMDAVTYGYLRNDLGYEGIVCLDWPLDAESRVMTQTGITADGVDISTLSLGERYTLILNAGVDMFSCYSATPGTDYTAYGDVCSNRFFPEVIVAEIEKGNYTEDALDVHVARVLKNKFDLGIFEDPYSDWDAALELIGNDVYKAEQTLPMTNEDINKIRRAEITEMEDELMVKSSILLKNDGVLPLSEGVKLYFDSNNETSKEAYLEALPAYATVVEDMADADYVLVFVTSFDETYDYMVEDAQAAGKPIILVCQSTITYTTEPALAQIESSAAILMQTYNNTPDHGSSTGKFYRYVTPSTTADMLFGVKEPGGSTVFEIAYDRDDYNLSWGDLQMDIGVDTETRLYMAMLAKENPNILMPNNLGNVLYTTDFGMNYTDTADIELSLLTAPPAAEIIETESNGRVRTSVVKTNAIQAAGVPFEISFVGQNHGADGHMMAELYDGDTLVGSKFVALDAGQFRVFTMEITLEAGEHVLTLGDMETTITVE